MLNYFQRSPEDTNTLQPPPNNERKREREKGEGESDGGRDTDGEENREGRQWGWGGGVNFNRVKMGCKSCFTARAVDNYANMMAA